ncbi:MAG: methionine adenosyltransferase [Candidatus Binataceae bacterium]
MQSNFIFMSESVTEGHPDKLCDQISDAIVDRFLQQDPTSAIIAECAVSTGIIFIAARFASEAAVDISQVARRVIRQVGYNQPDFSADTCTIVTSLKDLPRESRLLFDERRMAAQEFDAIPARNAVTVFGFACDQTPSLMPMPIELAHRLARRLTVVRREKILPYLMADGTIQVGVEFRNRRPCRVHSIAIVAGHKPAAGELDAQRLASDLREAVILPVFEQAEVRPDASTLVFINPEGAFPSGGPPAHSGLTGRKNAIDTYGEFSRHSGSALSGKDPSRIDRVGAYAARYAAKNVVASGLASQCEVMLSYMIGLAHPVSVRVETLGTGVIPDDDIAALLRRFFDFRLMGVLKEFELRWLAPAAKDGFFQKLAAYGQMGRTDIETPWERTDKAALLTEFRKGTLPL